MEKTSKITLANKVRNFPGKDGTNFIVFNIAMEDGGFGELICAEKNAPTYIVGLIMKYTTEQVNGYNGSVKWKMKHIKDAAGFGGGGGKTNPARENSIERQASLSKAVDLAVGGKIEIDKIITYAKRFKKYYETGE